MPYFCLLKGFQKGTRQRALTKIALIWDTKAEKVKNTKMAVVSTKRNSSTSLLLLQYDYHNEVPYLERKAEQTLPWMEWNARNSKLQNRV